MPGAESRGICVVHRDIDGTAYSWDDASGAEFNYDVVVEARQGEI